MEKKPVRVLHFADAHIDIANYGRHDPTTALPVRVMDFLHALDQIVNRAIEEKVDLVLFAGDAYKDRNPQPTFQREWGKRMMRLSQAGIPTVLLVGNHDVAPAAGRAHTLQEFNTLEVPGLHVGDRITRLEAETLGVPLQVITVPWVSRSQLMTREETAGKTVEEVMELIEDRVIRALDKLVEEADPDLPLVMLAHATVDGATYSSERAVMIGHDLRLRGSIVNDPRLDYVALGHIHKHQSLSQRHPPVVYPGSIEKVDFGEAKEEKGFVLAEISRGETTWEFVPLETRRFLDLKVTPNDADTFMADVMKQLPEPERVADAICRVQLIYPRDWETLLDEKAVIDHFVEAFSLQFQKHYRSEGRARLGDSAAVEAMSHTELLETYWRTIEMEPEEAEAMQSLVQEVLAFGEEELLERELKND